MKFWGKVQKGDGRGKKLGFPTANIPLHKKIDEGIYTAWVKVHESGKYCWYASLAFIGKAETFNKKKYKAEVYILDFERDLYGQMLTIQLLEKIRDSKKFDSAESLIAQMKEDERKAFEYFNSLCTCDDCKE